MFNTSVKKDNNGFILNDIFWIASENENNTDSLLIITEEESLRNSEEIMQLKEGCAYEYEILDKHYNLDIIPGIVHQSRKYSFRGRITPGNYVGRLLLYFNSTSKKIPLAVEVRSSKANYRTDYRKMLEEITEECTDLLMSYSSPVTQRFSVDFGNDSESLYQRFAFVQSLFDSADFNNAVERVITSPISRWKVEREDIDSRLVKRMNNSHLKQLTSGNNRLPIQNDNVLFKYFHSIPHHLNTVQKKDDLDNSENRFIKYVLTEFARFCGFICQKIDESGRKEKPYIYFESKKLTEKLSEWLNHNTFRDISTLTSLHLNNPVLQRKEGYREVFRIWLMYNLAAKLSWNGLDDFTYYSGKRDVATLYEYWIFFKLLRVMEELFNLKRTDPDQLIQNTNDGLCLQLKSGKHTAIEGTYKHKNRYLNIKYSYNRTFNSTVYPQPGSWTQQMRPDYTLSFWPVDFTEEEAETQEIIVHIHFDAKYKVENLDYFINQDKLEDKKNNFLLVEKELEKSGKFQRGDLLKMHAYKDAIRRTAGAYIIYPGKKSYLESGFHEIIPGLGAFPISPINSNEGLQKIKNFISEVLDHYTNRANQREALSYHLYNVMKDFPGRSVYESFPEFSSTTTKQRNKPPGDFNVLIGYVQEKQKDWILKNGLYNLRFENKISPELTGADFLIFYDKIEKRNIQLWKNCLFSVKSFPTIKNKEWLIKKKYPQPSQQEYFVYEISIEPHKCYLDYNFKIILKENEKKFEPIIRYLRDIL